MFYIEHAIIYICIDFFLLGNKLTNTVLLKKHAFFSVFFFFLAFQQENTVLFCPYIYAKFKKKLSNSKSRKIKCDSIPGKRHNTT